MQPFDEIILRVVAEMHRSGYDRIYPKDVQARLPLYRAEWTLRKDFWRLAALGYLVRIGGEKARRGYELHPAQRIEMRRLKKYGAL
jgi:hypothetical protein